MKPKGISKRSPPGKTKMGRDAKSPPSLKKEKSDGKKAKKTKRTKSDYIKVGDRLFCKSFQNGSCKFGEKCRYIHERVAKDGDGKGGAGTSGTQPPRSESGANSRKKGAQDKIKKVQMINLQGRRPGDVNKVSRQVLYAMQLDMKIWTKSKAWPLSCYGPVKYLSNLQGFEEVSAEEVRLAGMQASAEGRLEEYFSRLSGLVEKNAAIVRGILALEGEDKSRTLESLLDFVVQGAGEIEKDKSLGDLLVPWWNDFNVKMSEQKGN